MGIRRSNDLTQRAEVFEEYFEPVRRAFDEHGHFAGVDRTIGSLLDAAQPVGVDRHGLVVDPETPLGRPLVIMKLPQDRHRFDAQNLAARILTDIRPGIKPARNPFPIDIKNHQQTELIGRIGGGAWQASGGGSMPVPEFVTNTPVCITVDPDRLRNPIDRIVASARSMAVWSRTLQELTPADSVRDTGMRIIEQAVHRRHDDKVAADVELELVPEVELERARTVRHLVNMKPMGLRIAAIEIDAAVLRPSERAHPLFMKSQYASEMTNPRSDRTTDQEVKLYQYLGLIEQPVSPVVLAAEALIRTRQSSHTRSDPDRHLSIVDPDEDQRP